MWNFHLTLLIFDCMTLTVKIIICVFLTQLKFFLFEFPAKLSSPAWNKKKFSRFGESNPDLQRDNWGLSSVCFVYFVINNVIIGQLRSLPNWSENCNKKNLEWVPWSSHCWVKLKSSRQSIENTQHWNAVRWCQICSIFLWMQHWRANYIIIQL